VTHQFNIMIQSV